MNTLKNERGLSLSDVNKLYNYDMYRKKTINRTNTVAIKQFENLEKNKELVDFDENLTNLNTINGDSEIKIMSNTNTVTTTNEIAKNVKETKKDFANKLRKNSTVFATKKSIPKPQERSSSSESSGSYTSSSRSRSPTPKKVVPPPVKKVMPPPVKQQSATKFSSPAPPEAKFPPKTPKEKVPSEDQMEKLKRNYQFQGFHPYYDREADVLGLACCTCCVPKCKEMTNCCRGCSNLISCPVYCWALFILPIVIGMIIAMITLALIGAKVITG